MNKANRPAPWYAPWRSGAAQAVDDDPADMGTAFGLDYSLNLLVTEPPPEPKGESRPGWMQRLSSRRKVAD